MQRDLDIGFLAHRQRPLQEPCEVVPHLLLAIFTVVQNGSSVDLVHVGNHAYSAAGMLSHVHLGTQDAVRLPGDVPAFDAVGTQDTRELVIAIHCRLAILTPQDDRCVLIHADRAAVRDLEVVACGALLQFGHALIGRVLRKEVHGQPAHAHLANHLHLLIGDLAADGHLDLHHGAHPPLLLAFRPPRTARSSEADFNVT